MMQNSLSADNIESSLIIMMMIVFHEFPSAIHDGIRFACNDGRFSASIANEAQYDHLWL